jgi:hypothetical protein
MILNSDELLFYVIFKNFMKNTDWYQDILSISWFEITDLYAAYDVRGLKVSIDRYLAYLKVFRKEIDITAINLTLFSSYSYLVYYEMTSAIHPCQLHCIYIYIVM